MIVVPFTELSTRFGRKVSEFDLGHVVSEVPWRFPSEGVE